MLKSSLIAVVCFCFISVSQADTYKSYTYQDLTTVEGIDEESNVISLLSTDRMTTTIQALILQKKLSGAEIIKSIREVNTNNDLDKAIEKVMKKKISNAEKEKAIDILMNDSETMPNILVEIEDTMTGKCKLFQAHVASGYLDEKGEPTKQLNTWVNFVNGFGLCQ